MSRSLTAAPVCEHVSILADWNVRRPHAIEGQIGQSLPVGERDQIDGFAAEIRAAFGLEHNRRRDRVQWPRYWWSTHQTRWLQPGYDHGKRSFKPSLRNPYLMTWRIGHKVTGDPRSGQ